MAYNINEIPDNTMIIDTREDKGRIQAVRNKAEKLGINTITEALTTGDYCSPNVVIENKSDGDFVMSLKNKRLASQTERLLLMPQKVKVILINGKLIDKRYTKMKMESVIGQMAALSAQGISVVRIEKRYLVSMICRLILKGEKYAKN
jgi:ERCC4-type nuclease